MDQPSITPGAQMGYETLDIMGYENTDSMGYEG